MGYECFQHPLLIRLQRPLRHHLPAVQINTAVPLLKKRHQGLACLFRGIGENTDPIGCHQQNGQTENLLAGFSGIDILTVLIKAAGL